MQRAASIHRCLVQVKLAGVAHRRAHLREVGGLVAELPDVQRHQVAVLHPVAALGQPQGIAPRATTDVSDH